MPPKARPLRTSVLLFAVAVVVVAASLWAVLQPTPRSPTPFRGLLLPETVGSLETSNGASEYYALLNLTFSSPTAVEAWALVLTLTAPSNESIGLPNGSTVRSVEVTFASGTSPPWEVHLPGAGLWTGFSMTVANPDGNIVGGAGAPQVGVIEPDAVLNLTFPIGIGPAGFSLEANVDGSPGGAECTLLLPPGGT